MKERKSNLNENLVWIHDSDKNIIFYQESQSTNMEQLDFNFREINRLAEPFTEFYLIVDLTKAERPGAEIRQHIFEKFDLIKTKLAHTAIVTGKNFIINMAATFIFKKTGLKSYSIHKSLVEAEQNLEEKRQ